MTLTIRKATPSDAESILTLQKESWLDTYINDHFEITRQKIELVFSNREKRKERLENFLRELDWKETGAWVAEGDEGLYGYVTPKPYHMEEGTVHYRVGALYVDSQHVGKGIGSKLLEKVKELYADKDIYLEVTTYNMRAKDFYQKHGFVFTGVTSMMSMKKDDQVIFTVPLEEMVYRHV